MLGNYILDENHQAVRVDDVIEWARWFENFDRTVKKETIGGYLVSTVFLGLDHNFQACFWSEEVKENLKRLGFDARIVHRPLLFETMVFSASSMAARICHPLDQLCERCSTWEEALAQHEAIAAQVRKLISG